MYIALLIPLLGTILGSAFVFFMKENKSRSCSKVIAWFCFGCDGSGIGMVASDTRYGHM